MRKTATRNLETIATTTTTEGTSAVAPSNIISISPDAEQTRLFNAIMGNLNTAATDANGNAMIKTGKIPLSLCYVDKRYQGKRVHRKIAKLEQNWDLCKLGMITLVPHFEESRFAIVDGQGRFTVAPKKGMDSLDAMVLMKAPQEPDARLKFEAEYFIGQDAEVERLYSYQKHDGNVIVGDKAACILEKMLDKYNIQIVGKGGRRGAGILGSYDRAYRIAKRQGGSCLDFIFGIIKNSAWDGSVDGYHSNIMISLKKIWEKYPDHRTQMHRYLSTQLRKTNPSQFISVSMAAYPERSEGMACFLKLEDMVRSGLNIQMNTYTE